MIIIIRPVRRACVRAHLSFIGGDAHDWVFARLIVASAVVAIVLIVIVVRAFAVVVVVARAALIPWTPRTNAWSPAHARGRAS